LLKDFYNSEIQNFNFKERMIYKLTRWMLRNSSRVVFSTDWQRQIWVKPYSLDPSKTSIVENYYGSKEIENPAPENKNFIASSREIFLKNREMLVSVFNASEVAEMGGKLIVNVMSHQEFLDKLKSSYAAILVSLSEISPNMILEALRMNLPFICTKEVGIYERIKSAGIYVDPLKQEDVKSAVIRLLQPENYEIEKEKIANFNYIHTWREISNELISLIGNL